MRPFDKLRSFDKLRMSGPGARSVTVPRYPSRDREGARTRSALPHGRGSDTTSHFIGNRALVAVIETPDGVLIAPQEVIAARALDRIGEVLKQQGLSLEELMESGREARARLTEERQST